MSLRTLAVLGQLTGMDTHPERGLPALRSCRRQAADHDLHHARLTDGQWLACTVHFEDASCVQHE